MKLVCPVISGDEAKLVSDAGASGVYCGGTRFHARTAFLSNASINELKAIRRITRKRNVDLFYTVNSVINESLWKDAVDYVDLLCDTEPDGFIVTSLGLAKYIQHRKGIKVTLSALAGVWDKWTYASVIETENHDVTLSRGSQIKVGAEDRFEGMRIFCHGHSCVFMDGTCRLGSYLYAASGDYSGQCSEIAARGLNGNPCRRKWIQGNGCLFRFIANTSDYSGLKWLGLWKTMGVTSVKINGRTNPINWKVGVTRIYREAIDSLSDNCEKWEPRTKWIEELKRLCMRGEGMENMANPLVKAN